MLQFEPSSPSITSYTTGPDSHVLKNINLHGFSNIRNTPYSYIFIHGDRYFLFESFYMYNGYDLKKNKK